MFKNTANGKEFNKESDESLVKFKQALHVTIPNKVAEKMGKAVSDAFRGEQYPDAKSTKWKNRKIEDAGRRLLVQTGDLAASLQDTEINANGNEVQVTIGSDKVYAQIHNEGLQGNAFGKHKFTMPQRQFMPIPGDELPPEIQAEIDGFIDGVMDGIFG